CRRPPPRPQKVTPGCNLTSNLRFSPWEMGVFPSRATPTPGALTRNSYSSGCTIRRYLPDLSALASVQTVVMMPPSACLGPWLARSSAPAAGLPAGPGTRPAKYVFLSSATTQPLTPVGCCTNISGDQPALRKRTCALAPRPRPFRRNRPFLSVFVSLPGYQSHT